MTPAIVVRLLECSIERGAQNAIHGPRRGELAAATEPLALWNVWHTVALLVNRQVAQVAEEDRVRIRALAMFFNLGMKEE